MLVRKVLFMKRMGWFIGLLGVMALACNAPIGGGETPGPPQPVISVTTEAVPTLVGSPTAEVIPDTGTEGGPILLPTFTPIQVTAGPGAVPDGATAAPIVSPTEAATATPSPTATSDSSPLSFTYTIHWELASSDPGKAIATVSINATGGGWVYQYFRDDLPVAGPVFQYDWAACHANPGSLRVDSADGQTARVNYFETPPCPEG